ncbi:Lrp/AsnC family transcriptional regulator [Candidatus Woesearchaeota archaeon]|nr:Lrp/AsnC family transcriptional regulator [Candidatus Woesearchaeota archaeon]
MNKNKELLLLSHFRQNARESLTRISRRTSIPVSTIFDKLKTYENEVISKHTSLLDFRKLGFDLKAHLLFKVDKERREAFQGFLMSHPQVNNIFRINNGYDYLIEAVFTGLGDLDGFFEAASKNGAEERQEYFVLKDVAREQFLTYKPGFEKTTAQDLALKRRA